MTRTLNETVGIIIDNLSGPNKKTDRDIIGDLFQPVDEGKIWVTSDNNYRWHYTIGVALEPKKILEIGTRFGYSLKAFIDGSGHPKNEYKIWSVDSERDGLKCNEVVREYFKDCDLTQINALTDDLRTLRITDYYDLAHIDANDTEKDTYHNCVLAIERLRKDGLLLVDDLDNENVRKGFEKFCEDYGLECDEEVPSLHIMGKVSNNDKWRSRIECHFIDHDIPQKEYISKYVKNMNVLDVGCHQAEYTRLFKMLDNKVLAFEPSKRDCEYCKEILYSEEMHPIVLEQLALGDEEKEVDLHVYDDFTFYGYNSLKEPKGAYANLNTHVEKVKMTTIDGYLRKYGMEPNISFIKLDAEGGELAFLKGAKETLKSRPVIMCELQPETNDEVEEVIKFLEDRDYVWCGLDEEGCLFQTKSMEENAAVQDFFAIPREELPNNGN